MSPRGPIGCKARGGADLWESKSLPPVFALHRNSKELHFPSFISSAVATPPQLVYQKEEKRKMRIANPPLFPLNVLYGI